jgi:hypothetical protein
MLVEWALVVEGNRQPARGADGLISVEGQCSLWI